MIKKHLYVLIVLLLVSCSGSQQSNPSPAENPPAGKNEVRPDLEKYFQGHQGAFILYDLNHDHTIRYNPEGCAERTLPASTYKILHSLIALETGVAPDENFRLRWDGTHYDRDAWNQDQTLKSAVQVSAVWYFQEIARRIGMTNMQKYVDLAAYGNQDISGHIDSFWLDGSLKISPDEQVVFLKRLYQDDLPFSERSMKIVREILVLENSGKYKLSGKTGGNQLGFWSEGWFVGAVEKQGDSYFFATRLTTLDPLKPVNGVMAREISLNILRSLSVLP